MPGTEHQEEPRSPEAIQREIEERRQDLAQNISALGDEVREKLDVKKRAREAIDRGKKQARYALDRGVLLARSHPDVVLAIVGGVLALGAVKLARRSDRRRRLLH
jgi:hypothetical protein